MDETLRRLIEAGVSSVIKVHDITIDPSVQPRIDGLDRDHLEALMAYDDALPPILVGRRGMEMLLVDGFHRFARAQNLGEAEIFAIVVDLPAEVDLRELAFELNATHGLPLTLTDRRAEAARFLRRRPATSDREVGRHCGLTQPTVARVRRALESDGAIDPAATRVGRGGYTYAAPAGGEAGEEAERRRLGVFLYRLSTSLERLPDHPAYSSPDDAAACLAETYEAEAVPEIIDALGRGAVELLTVAMAAGFDPNEVE